MIDCYCLCCQRSLRYEDSLMSFFYVDDVICSQCRSMLRYKPAFFRLGKLKVHSLYPYEGLTRELLIQYKESRDEALFPLFLWPYIKELRRKYKKHLLVPIPSSREKMKERGFKTVQQLFGCLSLPYLEILSKSGDISQKGLHQSERSKISRHLKLHVAEGQRFGKILLVDDIVTTGETMKAAYSLLSGHCDEISALSISYVRR